MKPISNRPTQGPPIELYKGSPFFLHLEFPQDYIVPALTAEIRRNETLLDTSLQPTILASGQVRTVQVLATQSAGLPRNSTLLVYLDGVAKAIFPVTVGTEGTPKPGGTTLALRLDENLTVQLTLNDTDATRAASEQVALAQGHAQTALDAAQEAGEKLVAAAAHEERAALIAGAIETDRIAAQQARGQAEQIKTDVEQIAGEANEVLAGNYKKAMRVADDAAMLAACLPNQAVDFTVTYSANAGADDVSYTWDGVSLSLVISAADPNFQP